MAADAWIRYNGFSEYLGDGTIDMDNDTFKVQLHTSTYTPAVTHDVLTDLTNEVANGNGYTTGGVTLTSPTWTRSGATVTFDAADAQWTASGGSIVARYAVIYDDTPTSPANPLVAYSLLDNTPADVTVADGTTLTIAFHTNGILTLTGGQTG
jgi:hypothetical protein